MLGVIQRSRLHTKKAPWRKWKQQWESEKGVSGRRSSWARLGGKKGHMQSEVTKLVQTGWNKSIFYTGEQKAYSKTRKWSTMTSQAEFEKWYCCDLGEYKLGSSSLWLWPLGDSDISQGSFGQKCVPKYNFVYNFRGFRITSRVYQDPWLKYSSNSFKLILQIRKPRGARWLTKTTKLR